MGGEYKLELAEYVQWTEMYSEQKNGSSSKVSEVCDYTKI